MTTPAPEQHPAGASGATRTPGAGSSTTTPGAGSATSTSGASSTSRPAVLITGANRGIGRAVADELAADHHLILGGRDEAALAELAARYPSAEPFAADLADRTATAAAVERLELPDGLAGLVHSAGILVNGTVAESDPAEWTESFDLNVVAVMELTQLLLPALRAARGTVVMINSGSGYNAVPTRGAYSAAKFALRALADSLRLEEREHGVRVSSIHPGRVATDMQRQLRSFEGGEYQEENYMQPATVAATVGLALRLPADASIDSISVRPR
ncbi:SDR family oxidoreductase [Brachybacterium fresconis]|uniref:NADP-dependent 3-hydroxy acid dehydrogenase YdfG n=1 Tax=Brachybacterium fresconis TaxID=173363 RepID=A0ABS4YJ02_9MICO|nr:SDR family oxidoreductase [Brachybacterium fresconis]MBP2408774.1 NADP-dependent 3-hydroxy acid dehydrogenase YdfG [Brachybacterium fresconis]